MEAAVTKALVRTMFACRSRRKATSKIRAEAEKTAALARSFSAEAVAKVLRCDSGIGD